MKLTKGVITRDEAKAISPTYVAYCDGDFDKWKAVFDRFDKMKRGQPAITCYDGQFVRVKVTSLNSNDPRAVDGPIVRVSNGEYSWRCDGDKYAWPTGG